MQKPKQIAGILLGVGLLLGLKFYNKGAAHDELRAKVLAACEGEAACLTAVDKHFDGCFEEHYSLGGRRSAGGVDHEALVRCFNKASGMEHFSLEEKSTAKGVLEAH